MNVLITGAAGNLGTLLARYLRDNSDLNLVLMQHQKQIPIDLRSKSNIKIVTADLSNRKTIEACLEDVDVIVHFAGVLFMAGSENFLHQTNTEYFNNLVKAVNEKGIKKVILISFPHVEGPTCRKSPARGILDGSPISVHAQTRLEEERILFEKVAQGISLRVGMVYGKGILMIDAAYWFARKRLLGIWKEQTEIHLISKTDFCRSVASAIIKQEAEGIYHIGDEGNDTLQSFLDYACDIWRVPRPWRMPLWMIYSAAFMFETASKLFGVRSPLTRDFIDIGRVSYFGDTGRFRGELLSTLKYKTVHDGTDELKS